MSKRIGDGFMDYLETSEAPYLAIETTYGETTYLPGDVVGTAGVTLDDVRDYVDGEPAEIEVVTSGLLWRLTAPGYLDATEWTPADNEDEVEAEARETYDVWPDDDDDDDDDDEPEGLSLTAGATYSADAPEMRALGEMLDDDA